MTRAAGRAFRGRHCVLVECECRRPIDRDSQENEHGNPLAVTQVSAGLRPNDTRLLQTNPALPR